MTLKKSLLIALVIAIAVLFGMFYFNSTVIALSQGQIISLCLGAIAWLMLFLNTTNPIAITTNRNSYQTNTSNQLAQTTSTDINDLSSNYANLLSTIQSELGEQIGAAKNELAQVKSLMDGAIDDLVDSFISLEATTRIGQNLVKQMASTETDHSDDLNPFKDRQTQSAQLLRDTSAILKTLIKNAKQNQALSASITIDNIGNGTNSKLLSALRLSSEVLHKETKTVASKVLEAIAENKTTLSMVADQLNTTTTQIEKDVQVAVKSLQFQDMTTQLIVQSSERLNVMQEMLNAIDLFSKKSMLGDSAYVLQTKLNMAREELSQKSQVRIKQFNVDAGSVELFD